MLMLDDDFLFLFLFLFLESTLEFTMIPFEFGVWNLGLCLFLGIAILILYQHMGASGITVNWRT